MKRVLSTIIAFMLFVTMGFFFTACDYIPNSGNGTQNENGIYEQNENNNQNENDDGKQSGNDTTLSIPSPKLFVYMYNDATGNNTEKHVEIKYENMAETVLVVPERVGYVFNGWYLGRQFITQVTDGFGNLVIGKEIFNTSSPQLFAKWLDTDSDSIIFTYIYNDATGNNTNERVKIKYKDITETTLIVPEREDFAFLGWYADWLFNIQVSDEQGNIVIGNELFEMNSTQLFAKWLYNDYATYEILMVYVTEFSATLERYRDAPYPPIDVHYIMTDVERQIFELIGPMLEQYLNALLNGLVVFDVDTYFTTEPLGRNNVSAGTGSWRDTNGKLFYDYSIEAYNIPEIGGVAWPSVGGIEWEEIGGILRNYRTVFTTWGMNDWSGLLHQSAGSAGNKYGQIHIESLFAGIPNNGVPSVESLLDQTKWAAWWHTFVMALYLHEFTHTVELQLENVERNGFYGLHNLVRYFGNLHGSIRTWDMGIRENGYGKSQVDGIPYMTEIEIMRLFLLDQIIIDERTIGISFSFWKDPLPNHC